ncbi:hypothetical protein KP806_07070 [Paenibacillus sp. N4]|uniref:CBO0543 family protein n=1 Tax=Paenibacillus vietnamensis TaxID=2590547 RepID=UPI001CD076C3|nr:CBO0543 family protein [Paenibacillus vietnamensis]MCA0754808.1 hypothetical protein [Paenibacillus vietnamensis]
MGSRENEKRFLFGLLFLTTGLLPVMLKKYPRKELLIAFILDALTNTLLDHLLIKGKILSYPTRLLPRFFRIHILFDLFIFPAATFMFTQATKTDKKHMIAAKLLLFTVPFTLFECWAERYTRLIKWHKGWGWYYTFLSLSAKSLLSRFLVGLWRRYEKLKASKRIDSSEANSLQAR